MSVLSVFLAKTAVSEDMPPGCSFGKKENVQGNCIHFIFQPQRSEPEVVAKSRQDVPGDVKITSTALPNPACAPDITASSPGLYSRWYYWYLVFHRKLQGSGSFLSLWTLKGLSQHLKPAKASVHFLGPSFVS